jgi:hypothetical protein
MGTSGSYGGSGKTNWKKARDAVRATIGGGNGSGDGDPPVPPPADQPDVFDLLNWIGEGLRSDDSELRRPGELPRVPLSQILAVAGLPFLGRVVSGNGTDRPVIPGARRTGAALGGGIAIKSGNQAALAELGLDLAELRDLPPRIQTQRIIDQVFGASADENEQAFKEAAIIILLRLLENPEAITDYQAVIRDAVITAVYQRALIEIQDQLIEGAITESEVKERERQIRELIADVIRAQPSMQLAEGVPTPQECSHVMAVATLHAINALRVAKDETV